MVQVRRPVDQLPQVAFPIRHIHQAGIRSFAIVFIIIYLIDLVWETYIYLRMEKYIKNKSEHNKPPKEPIEL